MDNSELNFGVVEKMEKLPAVLYMRMSTEHQKYSIENQEATLCEYAEQNNFYIEYIYSDDSKSGLKFESRSALMQMISDIQSGIVKCKAILVLDISRWSRSQDADESAHYEFLCKKEGVAVHYVAEAFKNDGSTVANLMKALKRTSSGEYSRELSNKVFIGQCRLIRKGYKQGGFAGFGLRRMLIDEAGKQKGSLLVGEHKSIQTDRVILVPGPEDEVAIVNWIYENFANETLTESEIAEDLNNRGIFTDLGRRWNRSVVRQIITNEKYIGNNLFNRISYKLKKERKKNLPQDWIRLEGAFTPIVAKELFIKAQEIIEKRSKKFSNEEMLELLGNLYAKNRFLSGILIDEAEGLPSSACYGSRFGGLVKAYQLIGYTPSTDYRFIEINKVLRSVYSEFFNATVRKIQDLGNETSIDENDVISINDELTISIVIARCFEFKPSSYRWKIRLDAGLNHSFTIAVRMDHENQNILDYYILPSLDVQTPQIKLHEYNCFNFDVYRFDNLDEFFTLTKRVKISEAA